MPELPEVETIRRGLQKTIAERKIVNFEDRDPKVVKFGAEDIVGSRVDSIDRRAKMLILRLNNRKAILVHLKMTGQLIWEGCPGEAEHCLRKSRVAGGHPSAAWVETLPNKHTRAVFHFDDGAALFFNDVRRFGYLKLYEQEKLPNAPELKNIGPEPNSTEFSVGYLMQRAERVPNRTIKQFIMDQEIIAGVGNIYADESLFAARISPVRRVKDVSEVEWKRVHQAIRDALELGIKYGGTSQENFVDAFGRQGTMHEHLKVYRKTGEPCPGGCGGEIKRIIVGGRGTHYCPQCQH